MIFAAGLGTRLRPLTERVPKPLIEVGGVTLLERVARGLIAAGADRIIINTHHHAERIARFVEERGFGVEVRLSHESERPLDTGGGLAYAAPLFRRDAPFFMHNADVLTDAPLDAMYRHHVTADALVTLAVRAARDTRYLLFDNVGLCGAARRDSDQEVMARAPIGPLRRFDFAGIHVADPVLLDRLDDDEVFSIVWSYLRLAREGARIAAFPIDSARWIDAGSFEGLAAAGALFTESS